MPKFYKASEEVAAVVREVIAEEQAAKEAGYELSRKHGGSRVRLYTGRGSTGNLRILGFRFNGSPGGEFLRLNGTEDGWRPNKSTKVGKKLDKQLKALECKKYPKVYKVLGMEGLHGIQVTTPGLRIVGGTVYLHLPDAVTPPEGCVFISDAEMDQINETQANLS